MSSEKSVLRLAEQLDGDGLLAKSGADQLVRTVAATKASAARLGCDDLMAFATSAVREAGNSADVLDRVRRETGVELKVLSGEDEARYTFLAVRRWYGWSAGRLLSLDIGGGSLELAVGRDEEPDEACSVPLGAGRLTRTRFRHDPPSRAEINETTEWLDDQLAPVAKKLRRAGSPDRVVATSKTFRTLARLTGAAPSSAGPRARRVLTHAGLRQLTAFVSRMSAHDLAELEGVSPSRAHQLVAGALVAEATMRALSLGELEICPWALREGVILRRLDHTNGPDNGEVPDTPAARTRRPGDTGRTGRHGARWS